ncbi:O-antigen ligase family protein [Devosia psychrophila]|uniref:O-antigen ligase family protein n=1 Tax=Devosia psychrophila TaxID=728005 RepID=UPI00130DDD93|nr:O-antigen ligase family protein [Devosia psychrophila]
MLRSVDLELIARPIVWMPLAGLLLLAIAYGFGSGSISGLIGIGYFAPMLAIAPLLALNRGDNTVAPATIAVLSLCGVAGAAAVAVGEFVASGTFRAGGTVANPIHFADVALTVGFVATLGVVFVKGPWRYMFLAGPLLASVAVLFSGTRGAVVALVVMVTVAVLLTIFMRLVAARIVGIAALASVAVVGVAIIAGVGQTSGVQRVATDINDVMRTGLPNDASTELRLRMYQGGLGAFMASPLVGHGPFNYAVVASSYSDVPFETPHLHNDLADFASSGGVMGLLAYFLFLLAPVVEAVSAPASATRGGLIVIAASLSAGYFVMGLTNAMFGILNVTVCFAAVALVISVLSRRTATSIVQPTRAKAVR